MIEKLHPKGTSFGRDNDQDEDCYPLWGVFTTPSDKSLHQLIYGLIDIIRRNTGAGATLCNMVSFRVVLHIT